MKVRQDTVTVASGGTYSSAFTPEQGALFFGALFPAMDNGAIGLEMSIDGGTNYYPILDPSDGDDAVLCASGADPAWIDFSDWVRFAPSHARFRFTCAAQSSGAVSIIVLQRW